METWRDINHGVLDLYAGKSVIDLTDLAKPDKSEMIIPIKEIIPKIFTNIEDILFLISPWNLSLDIINL